MSLLLAKRATPGAVSADIAWVEADDTFAISGEAVVTSTLSWTEEDDAFAATGSISVSAALAWTEDDDVTAIEGAVTEGDIAADIAWAEENDGWNIYGVVQETPRGGGGGTRRHKRPKYWWEQAREQSIHVPANIEVADDFEEIQIEAVEVDSFIDLHRFDSAYAETVRILSAYSELLQEQLDLRLKKIEFGVKEQKNAEEAKRKRVLRMRKIAMLLLN